jgi:intracellular septation protein
VDLWSSDGLLVDAMSALLTAALWVVPLGVAWIWRPRVRLSASAWILLIAFAALGGWALWFGLYTQAGEPSGFAVWKPTILYWTLAAIMVVVPLFGGGHPARIIFGSFFAFSSREWRWLNRGFAAFYTMLGGVNLLVAAESSYKDWVGFKYACMMNLLIIILFRLNFVWLPILAEVFIHLYRRASTACRFLASLF